MIDCVSVGEHSGVVNSRAVVLRGKAGLGEPGVWLPQESERRTWRREVIEALEACCEIIGGWLIHGIVLEKSSI